MPSPNTITAFHDFTPNTLIRSSQVDNNFNLFRGHLMPIDGSAASFADNTYDLGSDSFSWRKVYSPIIEDTTSVSLVTDGFAALKRTIPTTTGLPPEFRFYEGDNTNYVGFRSNSTLAANVNYVLPINTGGAGTFLTNDGTGVLSWGSPAAAQVDFSALTAVVLANDDYVLIGDQSNSYAASKALASDFKSSKILFATAAASAATSNDYVECSGATFTLTLYAVSGNTGRRIRIKHNGTSLTQNYLIDGNGTETIDGTTSVTMFTNGEVFELLCNGSTGWMVIDHKTNTPFVAFSMTVGAVTTPPAKATVNTELATWRRVGDCMEIIYNYEHTSAVGATIGSGIYLYPIPGAQTIDSGKMTISVDEDIGVVGAGCLSASVDTNVGFVKVYSTTQLVVVSGDADTASAPHSSTFGAWNSAALQVSFKATVPITGWIA